MDQGRPDLSTRPRKVRRGGNPRSIPTVPMQQQVVVRRTGGRRPVDKLMVCIAAVNLVGTQLSTTLTTVTFPCTIVGLRWDLSSLTTAGTAPATYAWAIVKVSDGNSANALAFSNGATLYQPEQNVMAFGVGMNTPEDTIGGPLRWVGSTKTMRKMMAGDTLQFIHVGEATNAQEVLGCVQFFCKT